MRLVRAWKGALLLLAAAVVVGGCGKDAEPQGPDVLVTVNGEPVRKSDLDRAWRGLADKDREQYSGTEGVKKLIDDIVTWKLMAQEAERQRLGEDPQVKELLRVQRQQVLINALINKAVTTAEVYEYFQRNFLRLRFIQIAFPENAGDKEKEKARAKAEALFKTIQADTDFGELARKESQAANAGEGGEMGYVTYETLTNMVGIQAAEQVRQLTNPGEVSAPIEGKDGYYIFQLIEPSGKLDHRGLSPELENAIRTIKKDEVIRSYANELNSRSDNVIVFNEPAMKELMDVIRAAMEMDSDTVEPFPGGTEEPREGATADKNAPSAGSTAGPKEAAGTTAGGSGK
jgi:parvulin-like peptidyl-prolyl isomerase